MSDSCENSLSLSMSPIIIVDGENILENIRKTIIISNVKRQLPFMGEMVTFIRQHLHSFFWNSLWLSIGEIVNKLLMFYVVIAVIRYLRPEDYGQLSIAVATTNIIAVLLDFGMTQVIIRDLSVQRRSASVYLSQVISLKLILGIIYFVILLFMPEHLIGGKWMLILLLIGFMNWVQDLSGAFIAWFIAEERMQKVLYVQCVHYGGIMLATAIAISLDAGLAVLISGQVIAALAGLCTAAFLVFLEGIPIRLTFVPRLIKYLFEQSLPLFGVLLIGGIYANADTIMIREYQSINDVAYYQAAYKIFFVLQGLTLLHTALFPKLAIMVRANETSQTHLLNWIVVLFTTIVLVPIAAIASIYAPEIVLLIYGDKMLPAAGAMNILIWVGVIYFLRVYLVNVFISCGQQKIVFGVALTVLALYLILNALFLKRYSFVFAADVLLFTETLMLVSLFALRYMDIHDIHLVTNKKNI